MNIDDVALKLNSELRSDAREQLKGNWGRSILTFLVYTLIESAAAAVAGIGNLIVGGPLELGLANYFLLLARRESAQVEDLFKGFNSFANALVLYIVRTIFTVLWFLLFIVPGIVAALRYSMAFYILNDNPEMSGMEAINKSKEMMLGHKGKLFGLYFSFIGWGLLGILTLGIGYLWLIPYMKMSEANFYEDLKSAQK